MFRIKYQYFNSISVKKNCQSSAVWCHKTLTLITETIPFVCSTINKLTFSSKTPRKTTIQNQYHTLFLTMRCGSQISLKERAKVTALNGARIGFCGIANQLIRSRCVVVRIYLAYPKWYATKHKRQNIRKMTTKQKRGLFRATLNSTKTARTQQSDLNLRILQAELELTNRSTHNNDTRVQ